MTPGKKRDKLLNQHRPYLQIMDEAVKKVLNIKEEPLYIMPVGREK